MLSFHEVHLLDVSAPPIVVPLPPQPYLPPVQQPPKPGTGDGSDGSGGTTPAGDEKMYYLASCDSGVTPGHAVIAGTGDSVTLADNSWPNPVIGMVTGKKSPTTAVVQTAGRVVLGLSGLSPGVDYYLGNDGQLIAAPLTGVPYVQRVGTATTSTSLYLSLDGHIIRQDNG